MSESSLPLGSLLSSLMEHPEMLQQAMSIASSLASSGLLNNLMNTPDEGNQSASADRFGTSSSRSPDLSGIGNLLSGLMDSGASNNAKEREVRSATEHSADHNADFQSNNPHSGGISSQAEGQSAAGHPPHHDSGHNREQGGSHVGHAERIRLLQSLRPFLPYDKQEKIDFVIKLLGLLDAAERMGLGKLF